MSLFALIKTGKRKSNVRHFPGFPPKLANGKNQRKEFPLAEIIVIEEMPEGIFLIRYTKEGTFCGDTWHKTIGDAKRQANYEYGNLVGEYKQLPENITDISSLSIR